VFPGPPMRSDDEAMVARPVPPLAPPKVPVTSVARLMSEVPTTPAVARRTPFSAPIERVFETRSAEVDANDETVRSDVVAFDEMRFVVVPVETERFEIDDDARMLMPRVVVGVRAPCAISNDLPKSCDESAYAERSEKVGRPSDEVASCWYVPPAYEPRRIPAAVGFEMPVPPPAAPRSPASVFENVIVFPVAVMVVEAVSPLNAADDVAKIIVGPVCVCPAGPMAVMPETPEVMQVPFTAKQPFERLMPFANVDDALPVV
jgi:hypothetical protein